MYDHVKKALSRVYWQYKNSPKFLELIKSIPEIAQLHIEEQASKIADVIDIETAAGEWLDICGRIVGFTERPTYKLSPSCQAQSVTDDIFRSMIKAKIHKNNSYATIDDVKIAIDYILNTNSRVLDGQDMTMRVVWFDDDVSDVLVKILLDYDLMPRPQGVGMKEHRVITYKPFGFGRYYQNFGRATFWKGDGFKKYNGYIDFSFDTTTRILTGHLVTNDSETIISNVDITLIITKNDGTKETLYLVTGSDGKFTYTALDEDVYAFAKAQLTTPLCTTINIQSREFEITSNVPNNRLLTEAGEPLLTESGEYLTWE